MGELTQIIEEQLSAEEAQEAKPAAPEPEAQEEPQEVKESPDKNVLAPGVEQIAKAQADAEEAQEEADAEAEDEAGVDPPVDEAEEAEEPGGDRPEAGDAEAPEEEADEGPEDSETLTADDVPEDLEFEVKVDGEVTEVSLKELRDSYQLATFSREQIKETKKLQTKLQSAQRALMQDPMYTLEQLFTGQMGSAKRAHQYLRMLTGEWMSAELEYEALPPEQKQIWDEKRQLEMEKRRLTDEQAKQGGDRQQALDARAQEADQELKAAIRNTKLPNSKQVRQAVMDIWIQNIRSGIALTAEQAANIVKQRRAKHFEELSSSLPKGELIEQFPEFAEKVRNEGKKRVKDKKRQALSVKPGEAARPSEEAKPTKPARRGKKPKRFTSGGEYLSHLDKKYPR